MNDMHFTDRAQLERRLATWMTNEAASSSSSSDREINRILTATSRVRPDPRWLALLKESPMRTTTEAGPRLVVGTPARAFVLALLLVSLLAAAGLAVVASGILTPSVTPQTTALALNWRTTAPNGNFLPGATLALDPQGRIWVVDGGNARFAIYESNGIFVEYWQPSDGPTINLRRENGDVYGGIAFAADGSRFVLDVGNHRVVAYDSTGAFTTTWGSEGTLPGQFKDPVGILARGDGSIAVFDDERGIIETYDHGGAVLSSITLYRDAEAGENTANGFAIDAGGNLYVSQVRPGRVDKFGPTGDGLMSFGTSGAVRFTEQAGLIAIDAAGHVFVTQGPNRGDGLGVLVFNPDGTYAGGFGPRGVGEGQLNFPAGILLDGQGNLVVVDSGNQYGTALVDPSIEGYKIGLPTSK